MTTAPVRLVRIALVGLALLIALAHVTGVWPLQLIERLQLAIDDTRLRATLPGSRDERIVIVDIDERSLAAVGRWPWPRDRLAALADELFERQKAAVVGFDVVFAEPDRAHDVRLARSLAGRAVVLGFYLSNDAGAARLGGLPMPLWPAGATDARSGPLTQWSGHTGNLPELMQAAPSAGFFNVLPDADGSVRRMPLVAQTQGQVHATLALAMLRRQIGEPAVQPVFADGDSLVAIALVQGAQRLAIPADAQAIVRVPYRGAGGPRGGSFEYVSAADLLEGRLEARRLAGKFVLIGSTAPGVYDLRSTPVGEVYPGVEVHASLLSGLLDGRTAVQPDWSRGYEVLQLVAVAAILLVALPRLAPLAAIGATLGVALALFALDLSLYLSAHLVLPLATALVLTAAIYAVATSWGYVVEGRRRRSLTRLFGSYVPPELVAQMARDPQPHDMRAENRVLSVMFCDMRNFTRISEALPPHELRLLINRFFSAMTLAIRAERGTLDKYIGDAIMAFWGAPLHDEAHATHAVRAALAMVGQLGPLNADLQARGLPAIGLGVGINTGLVCVGDMGSEVRRSYTVMGDPVNLASRIEALTRLYGVDILVGEATRAAAGDGLAWVEVDRVRVKGKEQAVTLFTPVPDAIASVPSFADEMRLWQLALTSWRKQDQSEATAALEALQQRFETSTFGGLYRQLGERVAQSRRQPLPAGWDGTNTFDSK
jgi:adenylate cyclase